MVKKKRELPPQLSRRTALETSVVISLMLNLILILGVVLGRSRGVVSAREVGDWLVIAKYFAWHLSCNILLFYWLSMFNFRILVSPMKSRRKFFATGFGTVFICILASPVLAQLQWYALGGEQGLAAQGFIYVNLLKDMFLGVVVGLTTRYLYSNYKREQTIIANQKLMEENIRMRFEALKNQLDPHFLFNSLNTLNGLIGIDDDKARDYVENLSSVFRYTLNNKHIRTLDEELEYVGSYLSLLKIRYGDNLIVEHKIEPAYKQWLIMPVSIQLLVENAVKHNVISNKSPLRIEIRTTERQSIVVSNPINPKAEKSLGAGVGLANLVDRYAILFKMGIEISDRNGTFCVEVPLIPQNEQAL